MLSLPTLSAIYDRYETFSHLARDHFSGSLAGKFLLRSGLDAAGLTDLVAASIAGACSLCVEPEAERLREALRTGLCDFVVGPLDEALRILKNELRRGLPVSVGLTTEPGGALAAMVDRGLQPDLVSLPSGEPGSTFVERGALTVPARDAPDPGAALIEWSPTADVARSMPQIARIAAQSFDPNRLDTPRRQRWLRSAPRHLGRTFAANHCVRMTTTETADFVAAVRTLLPATRITRDGANLQADTAGRIFSVPPSV
ncbi:MAG TPA: hypothetical protein VHX13_10815 [Acidobacteriaceae bacterium]|jgi:hypothetical protein|nr:hypothetical protein [Acidobacteriaceae bacterium]